MSEKTKQILDACQKVIDGLEETKINGESAVFLCTKIARLTNDDDALEWLCCETSGYPTTPNGNLTPKSFAIAEKHGRSAGIGEDGKTRIFVQLIGEIEAEIESIKKGQNNFTTAGLSLGNASYHVAHETLASIARSNTSFIETSTLLAKRKAKLLSQYYEYALKKQIEVEFGGINKTIFESYQETADNYIANLDMELSKKIKAVNDAFSNKGQEKNSQALTSCRKAFLLLANDLFEKVLPNYDEKTFLTKSGKQIDVSGEHSKNKLSAVIETMTSKTTRKTLLGSDILYLLDLLENISDGQSDGVHNDIDESTARSVIIHTYIAFGELLAEYDRYKRLTHEKDN